MKWLFIIALIANIAFFTYSHFFYEQTPLTVQKKINPTDHQITLLRERTVAHIEANKTTHKPVTLVEKIAESSTRTESSIAPSESDIARQQEVKSTDSLEAEEKLTDDESAIQQATTDTSSEKAQSAEKTSVVEKQSDIKEDLVTEDLITTEEPTEVETTDENKKAVTEETEQVDTIEDTDIEEIQAAAKDSIEGSPDKVITEKTRVEEQATRAKTANESVISEKKITGVEDPITEETKLIEEPSATKEISIKEEQLAEEVDSTEQQVVDSKNILASRVSGAAETCFKLGPFSKEELEELKIELEKKYPNRLSFEIATTSTPTYYRIYIPPLNSTEEISLVLKKLDDNGLTDHYVMSINGRQNAIAIGVFKKRHAAEKVAKKAKLIGYLPTIEAVTNDKNSQYNLILDFLDVNDVLKFKQKMETKMLEYKACGN
jgi:hypothetical protein